MLQPHPAPAEPAWYMTGYHAEEAARNGIRPGKVLQKRFGADELLAEISQAFAG